MGYRPTPQANNHEEADIAPPWTRAPELSAAREPPPRGVPFELIYPDIFGYWLILAAGGLKAAQKMESVGVRRCV